MLTTAILQSNINTIRVEAAKFLLDTCQLYVWTGTSYVDGIPTETYTSYDVACRWNPRFGFEAKRGDTKPDTYDTTITGVYRLQLPYNTVVSVKDYIVFGGKRFDVVWVPVLNAFTGALIIEVREVK